MLIRMLTNSSDAKGHRRAGEIFDAPREEAEALIAGNHAEAHKLPSKGQETASMSPRGETASMSPPAGKPGAKPAEEVGDSAGAKANGKGKGKGNAGKPGAKPAEEGADDPPAGDASGK